ncbi:MAG: hypothetical protein ABI377_04145 [Devosia sp.]
MRIASIITGTVLAVGFSMTGVAVQSAYAVDAATITCGDFTKMSAADQDAGFAAVKAAMPAASAVASTSTGKSTQDAAKPPMDAGAVVADCQAASPSTTVMDAVMHAKPATTSNGG